MLRIHVKRAFVTGIIILVGVFASTFAVSAAKKEGAIKGKINYCGKGGYTGMHVFIPGRQFSVFIGQDGNFIFEGVPAGNYDINYVIDGRLVNENKNIPVSPGGTNDLGEIVFCEELSGQSAKTPEAQAEPAKVSCEAEPQAPQCVDADKDGVVAALDCNDNNPQIRPGAIELCDGVDNNCNGEIDEVLSVDINNGTGLCNMGKVSVKSCRKGFADCDKDPANGCETDIFNDNYNCGACGNICGELEICRLGIC